MGAELVKQRVGFNSSVAPVLAQSIKAPPQIAGISTRFAWFADDERLCIIAGSTEKADRGIDLALAYGLELAGDRELTLCLPSGGEASTLQRAAFLRKDAMPRVYVHGEDGVQRVSIPSRKTAVARVTQHLKPGSTLDEEMRIATTPRYLRGLEPDPVLRTPVLGDDRPGRSLRDACTEAAGVPASCS